MSGWRANRRPVQSSPVQSSPARSHTPCQALILMLAVGACKLTTHEANLLTYLLTYLLTTHEANRLNVDASCPLIPKSANFTSPLVLSSTFDGLMSRCTTLRTRCK